MKFRIFRDNANLIEDEIKNSGSINYYSATAEFSSEWDGLTKLAILSSADSNTGIEIPVIANEIRIDRKTSGLYAIGFIGYTIDYYKTTDTTIVEGKIYYTRSEQEPYVYTIVEHPVVEDIDTYYEALKDYQISTNLLMINFYKGAGELEIISDPSILPSPSQWETYLRQILAIVEALRTAVDNLDVNKQNKLTAGTNITIDENNVISATGGGEVSVFTNNSLGTIKGSEDDGKINANQDGTGNVNGWTQIKNRITLLEGTAPTKQDKTDNNLNTEDKTIVGAINEILESMPKTLSDLSDDSTHRVVTDSEKVIWNAKQNALSFDTMTVIYDDETTATYYLVK